MKFKYRTLQDRHNNPVGSLGHGIVERACRDLVILRRSGVVKGLECVTPYPQWEGKPFLVLHHYNSEVRVNELLDFFKNGWCSRALSAINSPMSGSSMCKMLGFEN